MVGATGGHYSPDGPEHGCKFLVPVVRTGDGATPHQSGYPVVAPNVGKVPEFIERRRSPARSAAVRTICRTGRRRCNDAVVTSPGSLRLLLAASAEGDDIAMAEFVRRTQPDVWRLCEALGSTGEVEDLVQETYLQAVRSAAGFRGDGSPLAWLLSIARNVCADHVRRRQRSRRLVERLIPEVVDHVPAVDRSTPQLLDGLAADRREAFALTQIVGLSYEEAAEVIGCPIGTVRSRVARARSDLLAAVRRSEAM